MRNIDDSDWLREPGLDVVEVVSSGVERDSQFKVFAQQVSMVTPERRSGRRGRRNEHRRRATLSRYQRSGPLAVADPRRRGRDRVRRPSSALGMYMFVIKTEDAAARARRARKSSICERSSRIGSAKPRTSMLTALSSPRSSATSARCCGSCRARRRSRACSSTSRKPGSAPASRKSCSSRPREIQKDFYAELPIKLRYTGSYHELGNFVSGIAALPRIVTLHDITIRPRSDDSSR